MAVQSEAALENALIHALEQMSYEYVKIEEESNLRDNFKCQLEKHNRKQLAEIGREHFTESEFEKILLHLEGGSRFEKSKKLRDLYPLETENGERVWVEFLNKKQWCQNEFQVSNQITIEGRKKCRYDVTILVNGLPLVQIELKKRGVELRQAYDQVQRYHKTSFHGLFDYIQVFCYFQRCKHPLFSPTTLIKATSLLSIGRIRITTPSTTSVCLQQCSSINVPLVR